MDASRNKLASNLLQLCFLLSIVKVRYDFIIITRSTCKTNKTITTINRPLFKQPFPGLLKIHFLTPQKLYVKDDKVINFVEQKGGGKLVQDSLQASF